ncbi:hypothetical protein [Sneathiella aquimaris]|uniref:hypothetical protein n=1 Tax=Sneathiella aquimaris TaxID=2599305 RepID=UPI00146DFDDE|nr:hypothetical protein [Sneathiella aquimaris]
MAIISIFRIVVVGILGVVLASCVSVPEKQQYADITFQHLAPIRLDVGEIRVVNEFRSPLKAPNVEHELPVKLDKSIQRWSQDRLRAVGNSNAYAVLTIKDASVIEKELPKTTGLTGLFTKDQVVSYEFNVNVELQVVTINGSKGLALAQARREKSISEEATLNERDRLYFNQTEIIMQDFDKEMEKNIRNFLTPFLR